MSLRALTPLLRTPALAATVEFYTLMQRRMNCLIKMMQLIPQQLEEARS